MSARRFSIISAALLLASPAVAQEQAGDEKINTVIIYGDDKCVESTDDVINVCARLPESDRYRIPKTLRDDPNDARKEAWSNRVLAYEHIAATGTMSCSATGAGGFTGCGLKEIDAAFDERKSDPGLAFGRMIAAERKKRLEGIDAEAEQVEQRVKQFEIERAERDARQEEKAAAEQGVDAEALPTPK